MHLSLWCCKGLDWCPLQGVPFAADTQKLSKQAIYCLHRGDIKGAETKLKKAIDAAQKLEPLVTAEPSLRLQGSYCGCLEEV
jgi:predicted translin family RNA/ssDNA-binding protein